MYEQFRNRIILALAGEDQAVIDRVTLALDSAAVDFDITRKETALAVRTYELPEAAKVYLVTRKMEGLSSGTIKLYKLIIEQFFQRVQKAPEQITANDIRLYMYAYQQERNISSRSLDGIRSSLSAFFKWCAAEDYIPTDPTKTIKPIKYEVKQRNSLTHLELEQLRSACQTPREKAFIEILYSTGCRISEIANCKLSDVDWSTNSVDVLGKGNKHRTVYLNAKAQVALKAYMLSRDDDCDSLIVSDRRPHSRITTNALERLMQKIVDKCPELAGRKITPHVIRHTTATLSLSSGMQIETISKYLGHSSLDTTMIYAEVHHDKIQSECTRHII